MINQRFNLFYLIIKSKIKGIHQFGNKDGKYFHKLPKYNIIWNICKSLILACQFYHKSLMLISVLVLSDIE